MPSDHSKTTYPNHILPFSVLLKEWFFFIFYFLLAGLGDYSPSMIDIMIIIPPLQKTG